MKPNHFCRLILVSTALGFISPVASGQGVPPDQVYASDIPNSLVPATRRGKEKTEQVDAQKLPSKSTTDTKFQGSLLDMGLSSTADTKSHEEKPASGSDKNPKASKPADAGGDKERVSKSTDAGGDGHNKDQKATSARPNEKASGSSTERTSATKN